MDPSLILTALNQTGELAKAVIDKVNAANAINLYTDRAQAIADLFDLEKHDDAYRRLYADMQIVCAKKGITPTVYYEKAPCISIPLSTLKELLDAATK